MTGSEDLYKFQGVLLPWAVTGSKSLSEAITSGKWGTAWHDGDTFNVHLDRALRGYDIIHVRPAGYNAPEITGVTKPAGEAATTYARSLVETGGIVYLDSLSFSATDEEDHFGRMLAFVTLADGRDLATLMIQSGHAVPDPAPKG